MKKITLTAIMILCFACGFVEPPDSMAPDYFDGAVTVEPTSRDSVGIQAALDFLPAEGGIVLLTSGEYDMDPTAYPADNDTPGHVLLRDNVLFKCEPGTYLTYRGAGYGLVFNGYFTDNVHFDGCDFVFDIDCSDPTNRGCIAVDTVKDFYTVMSFRPASNISVKNSYFWFANAQPVAPQTHMAILAAADDLVVEGNDFDGWQAKLGVHATPSTVRENISVMNNVWRRPFNFAVTAVSKDPPEGWRGIRISNNTVIDPISSGVFMLGPDGENADCGELSDVDVSNNVMTGEWGSSAAGESAILIRSCQVSRNWSITGNTIWNDGTANQPTLALRINDNQGHPASNVLISDNVVGGAAPNAFDLYGIGVATTGNAWTVADNIVDGARGITATMAGERHRISGNTMLSLSHGLIVSAQAPGIESMLVSDNMVQTNGEWVNAIQRNENGQPYGVWFNGNHLKADENGAQLWGGSGGLCTNNQPSDCVTSP